MPEVVEGEGWYGPAYHWEEWFDGTTRKFTVRVDFETTPEQFRNSAYQAAKRLGVKLRTRVSGSDVYLQRIE